MLKFPHLLGISCATACLGIVLFGWVAFPKIIKRQVSGMLCLKNGNDIRDMYLKVPFPLTFKIYMFNVTNAMDVAERGAMPIVQEIGPYVYDEWKEKVETIDNDEDDTIEYRIKNTFMFNQAESGSLTGNEVITMIHPLIAGVAMVVEKEKPGALSLLNKALPSIYRGQAHPFITTTVDNILFSGIDILCNVTDFQGKAVCAQLKVEVKDLLEVEPGIFKFSIFGPKNGTLGPKVKVKRGIKDIVDLGQVVEFEGEPMLDMWGSKECNTYEGTDSTIFTPFLKEHDALVSFAPDICRTLPAYFVETTKYDGVPVRRYSADFGDQSTIKEEKCYCPSEDFCYKKGIHDMSKCVGAPLVASLPHFYLSDTSYQQSVRGLHPTKEKHEIVILLEGMTATPVYAKKRMQFSMPLHSIAKIDAMKNMPEVFMPLFWVEEGAELNRTWTGQLRTLYTALKVVKVLKYIILLGTIAGISAAIYLTLQLHNDSDKPTLPITMVNNSNNKNNEETNEINETENLQNIRTKTSNNAASVFKASIRNKTSVGVVNNGVTNEIDKY